MKKRPYAFFAVLAFICSISLCGCADEKAPSVTMIETDQAEETAGGIEDRVEAGTEKETKEADQKEKAEEKNDGTKSILTGLPLAEDRQGLRPLAVMMSNDRSALPQYGINRAGVVYEAPVEGVMNRYMAIFDDWQELERMGSVRSCRTYYTYFAREFDAVYAHFGQSSFARPYLKNVDNINGVEGSGAGAFFRSKDKKAPHNAYTSGKNITAYMEKLGYEKDLPEDFSGPFLFDEDGGILQGEGTMACRKVTVGYPLNDPWFEYNEEDGLYYRYQYGGPHEGDEGQIAVKNLFIIYYPVGNYADTEYLNINVHDDTWGYYICGGRAANILTHKDGEFGTTHYYGPGGDEIMLSPGKTWICVMRSSRFDETVIEE